MSSPVTGIPSMSQKVYVDVVAIFDPNGRVLPVSLIWEDGRQFQIDRVVDMLPASSAGVGGPGNRYSIQINGRAKYLFFEYSAATTDGTVGKWFVERRAG